MRLCGPSEAPKRYAGRVDVVIRILRHVSGLGLEIAQPSPSGGCGFLGRTYVPGATSTRAGPELGQDHA
jgi:hypothetical protein